MSRIEVGCCGAYCKTCREVAGNVCRGCKLGYDSGERDLAKAKCAVKRCCLAKLPTDQTCADCPEFADCPTLAAFHNKKGYKYAKYRKALDFIRLHGYEAFLNVADNWRGPLGKLPDQKR
ncbi:MAG TPA: DUF3795 domain-containing protein [bacterium]|nr:DUF3795 domain-containing protein [bacterium]